MNSVRIGPMKRANLLETPQKAVVVRRNCLVTCPADRMTFLEGDRMMSRAAGRIRPEAG